MPIRNLHVGAKGAGAPHDPPFTRAAGLRLLIGAALAVMPCAAALAQSQPFTGSGSANQAAVAGYGTPSGEIHAAVSTQMIQDSHLSRDAAFARLSCAAGCADGSHLWAGASGGWSHQGSDGHAGAVTRDVGGVIGGADTLIFADRWRVGLLFGYDHASLDIDSRHSTASVHTTTYGAYAGTQWDAFTLKFGAAYMRHHVVTDRTVWFTRRVATNVGADYYGHDAQAFAELGYGLHWGRAQWQPYLQMATLRQNIEAFREAYGAASLMGSSHKADVTYATLGVHFVADSFQLGTVPVNARAGIGWRHAMGDVDAAQTLAFRAGGSAYDLHGLVVSRNAGVLDAGLDFTLAPDAVFSLSYTGQAGSQRFVDQDLMATMSVRF